MGMTSATMTLRPEGAWARPARAASRGSASSPARTTSFHQPGEDAPVTPSVPLMGPSSDRIQSTRQIGRASDSQRKEGCQGQVQGGRLIQHGPELRAIFPKEDENTVF